MAMDYLWCVCHVSCLPTKYEVGTKTYHQERENEVNAAPGDRTILTRTSSEFQGQPRSYSRHRNDINGKTAPAVEILVFMTATHGV